MPNRIRERRQAAGMTLQDVAEKLGTTAVTVSRWEREPQRVTLPILDRLADAIGCRKEELLSATAVNANALFFNDGVMSTMSAFYGLPAESLAVVKVVTDSMEPTLLKGDSCIIDRSIAWIDNAGIYAIAMNGEARMVRCQRRIDGSIRVLCDNEKYKFDEVCTDDDLKVTGKVIGLNRKI